MVKRLALILSGGGVLLLAAIFASFVRFDIPAAAVDAKYANGASRFMAIEGGRIHYRDQGQREGAVIVLLHGSNASLHAWEKWVEILGREYRVITLDLPGHGLTGRVSGDEYSIAAYMEVLDRFTRRLGLETFTLGGNSMGGHVSWRYALAHPARVESLILVDSSGFPPLENETPLAIFSLLRYPFFRFIFRFLYVPSLTEAGVREAYNFSPVADDALLARYEELNLRSGQRLATALRFAGPGERITPPAGALTMAALIMWGEEDRLINVQRAHDFARIMPNAILALYPGTGHAPMEEIPERSARDVMSFMTGVIRVYGEADAGAF